jgi:hypothetical protein
VDLNCGLRDKELRELRWQQINLVHKKQHDHQLCDLP